MKFHQKLVKIGVFKCQRAKNTPPGLKSSTLLKETKILMRNMKKPEKIVSSDKE
jgi:hypothetical protein